MKLKHLVLLFLTSTFITNAQEPPRWPAEFTRAAMQRVSTLDYMNAVVPYRDYLEIINELQTIIDSEPNDTIRQREICVQTELRIIEKKGHIKHYNDCFRDLKQQIRDQSIDTPQSCFNK